MSEHIPDADGVAREASAVRQSFWQHPFVQNVVALSASILLHGSIVLLGYATYEVVQQVTSEQREQVIVPDATIVEGAEVGGLPDPGMDTDPTLVAEVQVEMQQQTQKLAARTAVSLGALGGHSGEGVIGPGASSGTLKLGAFGAGDGGGATPFGVPGGSGGMAPKSPFMGVSGNARRIVYICDASGSMLARRYVVIDALKDSIKKLKPIQFFNVSFYHEGDFEQLDRTQLIPATPENKRLAFEFADQMETRDMTDPTPAIRAAMALKPELIYLLTDGFDKRTDDFSKKLRSEFRNLNSGRQVLVNVIYIADSDQFKELGGADLAKREEILAQLRGMAEENGGQFRIIATD